MSFLSELSKHHNKYLVLFSLILLCLITITSILYLLCGHKLIEAMYKNQSIALLNNLVHAIWFYDSEPLKHYIEQADLMLLKSNLLCLLIIALSWLSVKRPREMLLLLFSVIFVFIILEIYFRIFSPQFMDHESMFKYDDELGWSFVPNKRGAVLYKGEARHYIKTNKYGFRDTDFDLKDSRKKRILVMGDSFVSNISVKHNDVFTEILQTKLSNTEVMNLGVNGYSQVQEYLLLKKVITKFLPDLVLVQVYISNDFFDNLGGAWLTAFDKPGARLTEDQSDIEITTFLQPTIEKKQKSFLKKFHLYYFIKERRKYLAALLKAKKSGKEIERFYLPPEIPLCRKILSEDVEELYSIMEILLLKMHRVCVDRDVSIVFVIAPTQAQINGQIWHKILHYNNKKEEEFDILLPNKKLKEIAESNGVLMLDLQPRLQSEYERGNMLCNAKEKHWNTIGNKIVADEILQFMQANNDKLKIL